MTAKDAMPLPEILRQRLEEDEYARNVFLRMRPSCQKKYIAALLQAQHTGQKLDSIVREITKYGLRHKW